MKFISHVFQRNGNVIKIRCFCKGGQKMYVKRHIYDKYYVQFYNKWYEHKYIYSVSNNIGLMVLICTLIKKNQILKHVSAESCISSE